MNFSWLKTRKFWLFFSLGFIVLIITPLYCVKAGLTDSLLSIPSTLITLLFRLVLQFSEWVLMLSNKLLKWSAGGGIFSFSATNPATNPIINLGWTLLRDITNTMFVIGLAYIGLMTALDLTQFSTKKTFLKLIVVALFVNFSPVVCGFIVDISNIVGGFFLKGIDFSSLIDVFSTQRSLLEQRSGDIFTNGSLLLQSAILIFYGVLSGGILLLFAMLFFVRYPALWILTILSPLMFFFWIFDKTKHYFNSWWNQFLQWSFIVIPAGFFIYLSQHAVIMSNDMLNQDILSGEDIAGGVFTSIAPYFAAIIFLIFGLVMALKMNAAGAGAIMSQAKKVTSKAKSYGITTAKKTAKTAAKLPGKVAAGVAVGAAAAVTGAALGAARAGKETRGQGWKTRARRITGAAAKGGAKMSLTRPGREEFRTKRDELIEKIPGGRLFGIRPGYSEAKHAKRVNIKDEDKKKIKERLSRLSDEKIKAELNKAVVLSITKKEHAILMEILNDRNKFEFKREDGTIDNEKEKKLIELAKNFNIDLANIAKSRPDLTPIIKAQKAEKMMAERMQKEIENLMNTHPGMSKKQAEIEYQNTRNQAQEKKDIDNFIIIQEVQGMQPADFRQKVNPTALKNAAVVAGMDDQKRENVGKNGSKEQRAAIFDVADSPAFHNLITEMINESARLVIIEADLRANGKITEANEVRGKIDKLDSQRHESSTVAANIVADPNFMI